jgi:hypothetical protein
VQAAAKQEKKKNGSKEEDVYIGQGRYVKDDPKKYPSKTQLTGGWAGGEEGLQKWLEEYEVRAAEASCCGHTCVHSPGPHV